MKLFTLIISIVLLSSCAVMNTDECKIANWHDVGLKDASNGDDRLKLSKYIKACSKANVSPNQSEYNQGYQEGLKIYCTPQNMFDQGLYGGTDYSICPAIEHSNLKPYYDVSYDYYRASEERKKLLNDINRYESLLKNKDLKNDLKESYKQSLSSLELKRSRVMNSFYDAEDRMERFKRAKNLNAW